MLALDAINTYYGEAHILRDVSLTLAPGQVLALLGRNGAGKTTTLKSVMGLVRPRSGRISADGRDLACLRPYEIPRLGIAYVPQGRGLFPHLTVEENLRMGLLLRRDRADPLDRVLRLFPVVKARLKQRAGTLSGGEQQMVATARALCANPTYLLMDEPTEGLMPLLVHTVIEAIQAEKGRGVGILLIEQKIDQALTVADRVALIETGRVRYEGPPAELAADPGTLLRYLGVRRSTSRN